MFPSSVAAEKSEAASEDPIVEVIGVACAIEAEGGSLTLVSVVGPGFEARSTSVKWTGSGSKGMSAVSSSTGGTMDSSSAIGTSGALSFSATSAAAKS